MIEPWKNVIQANAQELNFMGFFELEELETLRRGRMAYFRNNLSELEEISDSFKSKKENIESQLCSKIFQMRLQIRKPEKKFIIPRLPIFSAHNEVAKVLSVEFMAVEAILLDINEDFSSSAARNTEAYKLALELGMKKKASALFYNALVSQNHSNPQKVRIDKLEDAKKLAEDACDSTTLLAINCSLSSEYQAMECYELAYRFAVDAESSAAQNEHGSFNHGASILILIESAISLSKIKIVKEKLKILKTFEFIEFEEGILKIESQLESHTTSELKKVSYSGDEQTLVEFLSNGAKTKYDILDQLYGINCDESMDNRFKQLLLRIRRKDANIISYNKNTKTYGLNY